MSTKTFFLTICQIVFIFLSSGATVWTVSNNPNIPAQFTNVNDAITAASNGDTIYIHGSPNVYGYVNLNKRLILVGPGHNPKNATLRAAYINELLIVNKNANNSVISGLTPKIIGGTPSSSDTVNLTIKNCSFTQWGGNYINIHWSFTNMVIENCIFGDAWITFSFPVGQIVRKGLVIRNNIFGTRAANGASITGIRDNSIIDHNIFLGIYSQFRVFEDAQNCTFSNNIFYGRGIDSTAATNSVFLNNLTYICTYDKLPLPGNSGTGNLVGVDPGFMDFPNSPSNFSYNNNFRLEAGSPAKNAATDGSDLGVYGGPGGFSMTGEPHGYPVIRSLDIYNTTVPPQGTLDIRIKSTVAVDD